MSFFIIHNAKSANLLISAYLLDGQNIKIVCRVSGYVSLSLFDGGIGT